MSGILNNELFPGAFRVTLTLSAKFSLNVTSYWELYIRKFE